MKLKNGQDAAEALCVIHPETALVLKDFDAWSKQEGLPELVITELGRSLDEQGAIYLAHAKRLTQSLCQGPRCGQVDPEGCGAWRPVTPSEQVEARSYQGKADAELLAQSRKKFSWHIARTAADIRCHQYTRGQLARVQDWFQKRCKAPGWEYLTHDIQGMHIHIGRRDPAWRLRNYDALVNPVSRIG